MHLNLVYISYLPHLLFYMSALWTDCACIFAAELQGGKAIVEEAGPDESSVSNHIPAQEDAKGTVKGRWTPVKVTSSPLTYVPCKV